jgi:hypothetical protein
MQALFAQDQDSSSEEEEEDQLCHERRQSSVAVLHGDSAYARDPLSSLLASAMPTTQEVEELYDEVSVSLRPCNTVLAYELSSHQPPPPPSPPHSARTLSNSLPRHSALTLFTLCAA